MFEHSLTVLIGQYGYSAIFCLVVAGIVGLPVPDQLLLVLSGYCVLTGSLGLASTLGAAILGSVCGITLSYALGRASGSYLSRVTFAAARLENANRWFERFGKWTLLFGYFVPGVRNFIGFVAGMTRLTIRHFAPYAYAGATISSVTCVLAGYFLGEQTAWAFASPNRILVVAIVVAGFFVVRKSLIGIFPSFGRPDADNPDSLRPAPEAGH
jgi:membrane protein DedA with SNARE-associated domain